MQSSSWFDFDSDQRVLGLGAKRPFTGESLDASLLLARQMRAWLFFPGLGHDATNDKSSSRIAHFESVTKPSEVNTRVTVYVSGSATSGK